MFKEGQHWVPVNIANLAVTTLEMKIANWESKYQILRQEYTALVRERGESIKKLEDEVERLRKELAAKEGGSK